MPRTLILYLNSDMVLSVPDVTNAAGTAQTDATVQVTLLDNEGNALAGMPINCPHVSGGTYEGLIPDDVAVVENGSYQGKVVITLSNGRVRTIYADVRVKQDKP